MSSSASSSKGKGKAVAFDEHEHEHEHEHGHSHSHGHEHEHGDGCCSSDAAGDEEPQWPVITADEIEAEMVDQHHFMDDEVIRRTACLTDLAGMENTGVAVHRVHLEAGRESTMLHSHLSSSEWIYVLSGSVTLVLARTRGDSDDLRPGPEDSLIIEETALNAGDFAGFPAGPNSERWAHTLRAGNEACDYLLGGDRKDMDVITYPVRGQTLVYHEGAGQCMFDGRAGPN